MNNLSWVRGAHQFKFGIDYRRIAPVYGPREYQQTVFVLSQAEVIAGNASFMFLTASQGARPIFNNLSVYAQDSWKVTRRLTLDLGLRWELNPAPRDANGLEPVLVTGIRGTDVSGAALAPPGTPFYETFYGAFAPRVGVAYQLRKTPGWETVVRGGFGVFYDLGSTQATAGFGAFPFSASITEFGVPFPTTPQQITIPSFPAVTLPLPSTASPVYAFDPDLKLPYTLQWNVALQQSLGGPQTVTLSYVAATARRLLTNQSLNALRGNPARRPNPNFRLIALTSNGATSDYHSLQIQYQSRLSRGLQALANYTWSHAIDEVSNEVVAGTLERGNADFDVRHNFSAGVTYDIPKPHAGPVLAALFRNWSLDSTIYALSGPPVNLFDSLASLVRQDGTVVQVRPDVVSGQPFWIKDPNAPGGTRINRAAFQFPPTPYTRQGTLGRNVVRLPGTLQINMGLRRRFNLTERWNLQFRAEAFNLFNHPAFGFYNTNLSSQNFGLAERTLNRTLGGLNNLYQFGGNRSMQISLRLSF